MSALKNIDDVLLHRFFDGDLDEHEAAEVQAALDADPSLADKLAGLDEVRLAVRALAAQSLEDLSSDALWARVEAGISADEGKAAAEPARSKPALRAIAGGAASSGPPRESAEPKLLPLVVGALAIAAVALLAIWAVPGSGVPGGESPQLALIEDAAPSGLPSHPELAPEETVLARTEIIEVDFGPNSGTIFAVEGDQEGERFAVVWLADIMPKQSPEK